MSVAKPLLFGITIGAILGAYLSVMSGDDSRSIAFGVIAVAWAVLFVGLCIDD